MYCVKVYELDGETLVACCDANILGKTFSDDNRRIHVKESFYGTDERDLDDALTTVSKASIANLTGNDIVSHAVDADLVDEACVIDVGGVKHAQIVTC